jgi:hypothetical protein
MIGIFDDWFGTNRSKGHPGAFTFISAFGCTLIKLTG